MAANGFRIDPFDLAKEIAGLANSGGGQIFLGVEDDGRVTGIGDLKQSDQLMRQVSQVAEQNIQPSLWLPQSKLEHDGLPILLLEIPAFHADRPFSVRGVYYLRDGPRLRQASRPELAKLFQSTDHHFDEEPVRDATRSDLDIDAFLRYAERAYRRTLAESEIDDFLTSLKCLDPDGAPTVAGILMFGREPQRWLIDARISAAHPYGSTLGSDFIDRRELEGRLPDQIEAAELFLRENLARPAKIEGWKREERPPVPESVLREAVLNAVTHRDYRVASQVRLFVFDDRIEVVNPGTLLNKLTIENIRKGGITQRRNPVLASLLSRSLLRENVGRGVPEMYRQMAEAGYAEPRIELRAGQFELTLPLTPPSSS